MRSPLPTIENPSFEILNGQGHPVGWNLQRTPQTVESSGQHYVRVSRDHSYFQSLGPVTPYQTLTVAARVRSELGRERAVLLSLLETIDGPVYRGFRLPTSTEFQTVYQRIPIVGENTNLTLYLQGATRQEWVEYEQVSIFNSAMPNPGFEDPLTETWPQSWELTGGAARTTEDPIAGTASLLLPPGATASIALAAAPEGNSFLRSASKLKSGGVATLTLELEARDSVGSVLQERSQSHNLFNAEGHSINEFTCPPFEFNFEYVQAIFHNEGPGSVVLDETLFHTTLTDPLDYYQPAPSQPVPAPTVRLMATVPGRLESASARVSLGYWLGASGAAPAPAVVPMTVLDDSVAFAEWDASHLAANAFYQIEYFLTLNDGKTIPTWGYFLHKGPPPLSDPPVLALAAPFPTGAWLYLRNLGTTAADLLPHFQAAKADGFDFVIAFARLEQWPAVVEAATTAQMPFFAGDFWTDNPIKAPPELGSFRLTPYRLPDIPVPLVIALESPLCLGPYLVDEPIGNDQIRRAYFAQRAIAHEQPFGPPLVTLSPNDFDRAEAWDLLDPAIHITDFYPYLSTDFDAEQSLREVAAHVRKQVGFADVRGKPFWFIAQAFGSAEGFRLPNEGYSRALIGLVVANGGDGIIPFVWYAVGHFNGLRSLDLEPNAPLRAWLEELSRLKAADTDLFLATSFTEPLPSSGPIHATEAIAPTGERMLFLVSLDVDAPQAVHLEFSTQSVHLTELTGKPPLEGITFQATLELEPGGWRAYRFSNPAAFTLGATSTPKAPLTGPYRDLPREFDLTLSNGFVTDIDFHPTMDLLAVSAGPSLAIVDGAGTILDRDSAREARRAVWADGETLFVGDWAQGILRYDRSEGLLKPAFTLQSGLSQGGLTAQGTRVWTTLDYLGVRALDRNVGETLNRVAHIPTTHLATDLVGPLANGSLLVLGYDGGIERLTVSHAGEVTNELQEPGLRFWRGDLSPDRSRLAVARNGRGFSLHALSSDGTVTDSVREDQFTHWVEDVAWLTSTELAVAQDRGEVFLFHVGPALQLEHFATLLPRDRVGALMTVASDRRGHLALGYGDGRVILLDVSTFGPALNTGLVIY